MLFFRITSDLVPFASHPVCNFSWQDHFADDFTCIGAFILERAFRISMHPDQFVLLNSPDPIILRKSIADLQYQIVVLDLMGLDRTAKVQIHVGGIYGNKPAVIDRFVEQYAQLDDVIRCQLVIENDEHLYSISNCLKISKRTGVPVLFDYFHHSVLNTGELFSAIFRSWEKEDGIPLVDYSSQQGGKRPGALAETIDTDDFSQFLFWTKPYDFDLMLEIKTRRRAHVPHFGPPVMILDLSRATGMTGDLIVSAAQQIRNSWIS
jgi:UV DNA damage endonuclease